MPQMDYTMIRTVETDPKGMATQTGGINGGILSVPQWSAEGPEAAAMPRFSRPDILFVVTVTR